jgi:signal transduction histidine kinase
MAARRWNWRDALIDLGPPVLLLIVGMLDIATGLSEPTGTAPPTTAIIPAIVVCAALLVRRRWPLVTFGAVVLVIAVPAWLASVSLSYWGEFVPWLLAGYSVARHEPRLWRALIALAGSALTLTAITLRFPEMGDPGDLLYNGAFLAASWGMGLFAKSWATHRDDALRLEVERAQAEERAGLLERARIARELHDVIAHTITVVVMQAGGARRLAARDPAAAVPALTQIEALGRDSLAELRTLLTVLRGPDDDEWPETAPQPTLADLGELCERMRRLGLPITLRVGEHIEDIPLGMQLTAYRAVQEGLTNVLKHSGPVATDVTVERVVHGELVVEVVSAPGRERLRLPGAGRGLTGVRERAALVGGTVAAAARSDGGFVLRVELPLGGRTA